MKGVDVMLKGSMLKDAKERVGQCVRVGLLVGKILAALACVVTIVRLVQAPRAIGELALGLVLICAYYLLSGVLGGVIVGTLLPIGRWLLGRILIAVVVMTMVYFLGYPITIFVLEGTIEAPPLGMLWLSTFAGIGIGCITWITDRFNRPR